MHYLTVKSENTSLDEVNRELKTTPKVGVCCVINSGFCREDFGRNCECTISGVTGETATLFKFPTGTGSKSAISLSGKPTCAITRTHMMLRPTTHTHIFILFPFRCDPHRIHRSGFFLEEPNSPDVRICSSQAAAAALSKCRW